MLKRTALLGAAATLSPGLLRAQSSGNTVTQPALPYAFDALEPAIDRMTMEIHYGKHHAGYVRNYNAAAQQISGQRSLEQVLSDLSSMPEAVRTSLRNNGGGVWNHNLFWDIMAPPGTGGQPEGELAKRITSDFGSIPAFKQAFSDAASSRFGSGWAWLIVRASDGRLAVTSTPNQDNPLMKGVVPDDELGTPLLGLDVWEHAYYLHYQNRRGDYISNWWKLVNWSAVEQRLA
jgi:Fe-Mn family superoxide dismutase